MHFPLGRSTVSAEFESKYQMSFPHARGKSRAVLEHMPSCSWTIHFPVSRSTVSIEFQSSLRARFKWVFHWPGANSEQFQSCFQAIWNECISKTRKPEFFFFPFRKGNLATRHSNTQISYHSHEFRLSTYYESTWPENIGRCVTPSLQEFRCTNGTDQFDWLKTENRLVSQRFHKWRNLVDQEAQEAGGGGGTIWCSPPPLPPPLSLSLPLLPPLLHFFPPQTRYYLSFISQIEFLKEELC